MESHFSVKTAATTAVNLNRYRLTGRTQLLAKDKIIPQPEFLEGRERVGGHAGANEGLRQLLAHHPNVESTSTSSEEEDDDGHDEESVDISAMPKFTFNSLLRQWKLQVLRNTHRDKKKLQLTNRASVSPSASGNLQVRYGSPSNDDLDSLHNAVSTATSDQMGLLHFKQGRRRNWADPLFLRLEEWFIKGDDSSWFSKTGFVSVIPRKLPSRALREVHRFAGTKRPYAESDDILHPKVPETEGYQPSPLDVDELIADLVFALADVKSLNSLSLTLVPLVMFPHLDDGNRLLFGTSKIQRVTQPPDPSSGSHVLDSRLSARDFDARRLTTAEQAVDFHPKHYARLYCVLFRGLTSTSSAISILALTQCDLTDGAVLVISEWLQDGLGAGRQNLLKLDLSNNCISSLGVEALATTFKNPQSVIEELSLHGNPFGDPGAPGLCDMLNTAHSLLRLDIGFCRISSDIAKVLFKALGTSHIHHLSLEGMGMSSQASLLLVGAVSHNTTLTSLNLRFNQSCSSKQFRDRIEECFERNAVALANSSIHTRTSSGLPSGNGRSLWKSQVESGVQTSRTRARGAEGLASHQGSSYKWSISESLRDSASWKPRSTTFSLSREGGFGNDNILPQIPKTAR